MVIRRSVVSVLALGMVAASASAAPKQYYRVVAQSNQVMPDGTTVRLPHEESISEGDVVFEVSTNLQESQFTVWAEIEGELTQIAKTGDTADGATVASMLLTRQPPIARMGKALFLDDNYALWKWDGTLHLVAKTGDVIDGGTVGTITNYMMNSFGDIVFRESNQNVWYQLSGSAAVRVGGPGITHPSLPGVPLVSTGLYCAPGISDEFGYMMVPLGAVILVGLPGSLVPIYRKDAAAPGGGTWAQYLDCQIAMDTGTVTVLSDDFDAGYKQRIYRGPATGPLTTQPALPTMTTLSGANRRMVADGEFAGLGLPYAGRIKADGTIERILTVGDPAPGLSGETIASIVVEDINAAGQVLMTGTTSTSKKAIWTQLPGGVAKLVVATGETIDIGPPGVVVTLTNVSLYGASGGGGYHMLDEEGNFSFHIHYTTAASSDGQATMVSLAALIVNSDGDEPLLAGSNTCDTGQLNIFGDPECTLRAAIELANSRTRKSIIRFDLPFGNTIEVDTALPEINNPIDISADDDKRVTITPTVPNFFNMDGLYVVNRWTVLKNLDIKGFGGMGVRAVSDDLQLYGCDVTDNSQWGVYNELGTIYIDAVDAAVHRGRIARNGRGGVYGTTGYSVPTGAPTIVLTDVDIYDNGGAGVVSDGRIDIASSTIATSKGPGVAVLPSDTAEVPPVAVTISEGGDGSRTAIHHNQGSGIDVNTGGTALDAQAPVAISNNNAWGITAYGVIKLRALPIDKSHEISVNGVGSACYDIGGTIEEIGQPALYACGAGGILSSLEHGAGVNDLRSAYIEENNGPGVLARALIDLGHVQISRNHGPGVMLADTGAGGNYEEAGVRVLEPSTFSENLGPGIYSQLGSISAVDAAFYDNHGPGIQSDASDVFFGFATVRSEIDGNGAAGVCTMWQLTLTSVGPTTEACASGGIHAELGTVSGAEVNITNNTGNGITAATVELHDARICGNTGEAIVATTQTLGAIDLTCGDDEPPGEDPPPDEDDGCLQATPTGSGLPVLAFVLAALRRRKRKGCLPAS